MNALRAEITIFLQCHARSRGAGEGRRERGGGVIGEVRIRRCRRGDKREERKREWREESGEKGRGGEVKNVGEGRRRRDRRMQDVTKEKE